MRSLLIALLFSINYMNRISNAISTAKNASEREGITYLLKKGPRFVLSSLLNYVYFVYYSQLHSDKTFTFQSQDLNYFFHPKGTTWRTERSVEIPIIWNIVTTYKKQNKRILEVGNVLSYRFKIDHDVLDKYEKVPNLINEDVISFRPKRPYDIIVSISTMEHVGWDEIPKEPSKFLKSLANLNECLSPNGMIVMTLPLGYNTFIDDLLSKGNVFDEQYFLKRVSNLFWKEAEWKDVKDIKYNLKDFYANAILIGINHKK